MAAVVSYVPGANKREKKNIQEGNILDLFICWI